MVLEIDDFLCGFSIRNANILTNDGIVFQGLIMGTTEKHHHADLSSKLDVESQINNDSTFITLKLNYNAAIVKDDGVLNIIKPPLYKKGDTVKINVADIASIGPGGVWPSDACDSAGSLPVTSGLNGAPVGTADLERGNKYDPFYVGAGFNQCAPASVGGGSTAAGGIYQGGTVFNWIGDTMAVCEPGRDSWSIAGSPPMLKDGSGAYQTIPTLCACFNLVDGSKLIISALTIGSAIAKARVVFPSTELNPTTLDGFALTEITVYNSNFMNFSKVAAGKLFAGGSDGGGGTSQG